MALPAAALEQAIDWELGEQQVGLWGDAWTRAYVRILGVG